MDTIERIFTLMEKRGVKAVQLTKDLALSHGTVSQWKKGLQKPSTEAIVKIANYFGVTTDYLLTGKQPQSWPNQKEEMSMYQRYVGRDEVIQGLISVFENGETCLRNAVNIDSSKFKTFFFNESEGVMLLCVESHRYTSPGHSSTYDRILEYSKKVSIPMERLKDLILFAYNPDAEKYEHDEYLYFPSTLEFDKLMFASKCIDETAKALQKRLSEEFDIVKKEKNMIDNGFLDANKAKHVG